MAISVFVLLFTGVLPIVGVDFDWLTIHWVAGLILTAAIVFHTIRAIFWQSPKEMWVSGARTFRNLSMPGRQAGQVLFPAEGHASRHDPAGAGGDRHRPGPVRRDGHTLVVTLERHG